MNLIYRTNKVAKNFNKNFPEEILLVEPTKVLTTSYFKNKPQKLNWLSSNRTVTVLTEKSIFFNNKKIDITKIKDTKLFLYKTFLGLISYQVFCFLYEDKFYYLGMNSHTEWLDLSTEVYPAKKINYISTVLMFLVVAVLLFYLSQ
jgi:hypothetical protein